MNKSFYSHGKLLLTGEYAVLDGALSLAVPTKKGQSLRVRSGEKSGLEWVSLDPSGHPWFEASFDTAELLRTKEAAPDTGIRGRLLQILRMARQLNPEFLNDTEGLAIETQLEFPTDWGLGSSSTLIRNVAIWAQVNAFDLHRLSFGGSGYDIACAGNPGPILFQLKEGLPNVKRIAFSPSFADQLYFVHLNRKQDSRAAIRAYRQRSSGREKFVSQISEITVKIQEAENLQEFAGFMDTHEKLISTFLGLPMVQDTHFDDFPGHIKSLGAWGGDFILAAGGVETMDYFIRKGHPTVLSFKDMVL